MHICQWLSLSCSPCYHGFGVHKYTSLPVAALFSAEIVTPLRTIPGGAYPASLWFLDGTESILDVLEFALRGDFSWWAPTHLTGAKEMVGFHLLGVRSFVSEEWCLVWRPPEKRCQQTGVIWAVIICKQAPKIQVGRKPQSLLVRQEQSLDRVVSLINGVCVMERHAFLLSHDSGERQGVGK